MEYLHLLGFPKGPVETGYDVVDNEHFSRCPKASDSDAVPIFLVSCRFVPVKNLKRLLIAYAAYRRLAGNKAWGLVIAGDGPEKNNITAAIEALGLDRSVSLAGFVQYSDLPALYARAGAFILPSVSEPWGLVVNEAMAASLPVLVSNRCGCAPDLVEENCNGFTFDPHNSDELARLMLHMSSMPVEARIEMGIASRRTIGRWTPEIFATNLVRAVEFATYSGAPQASFSDKALLWALIRRHGVLA